MIKRLLDAPKSYKELLHAADKAFGKKVDTTIVYKDEDGDIINVTDDNDLEAAYADCKKITFSVSEA